MQVRAEVSSLKTLLLTLFFTAMGMLSDPAWIRDNLLLLGSVVAAVLLCKTSIVFAALRLFRARGRTALATGVCLGQIGEFSFVLADIARGSILSNDLFMLVVSTTIVTMVLSPYLVAFAPRLAARLSHGARIAGSAVESVPGRRAIVVGYGPAGRIAAERIAELGDKVVVLDQNPAALAAARAAGHTAVTGDARYGDVLEHAGLVDAEFVVMTVPDPDTAIHIIRCVRQIAPHVRVLARARFHRTLEALTAAGAHVVIDEEKDGGLSIARAYEEHVHRAREKSA